MTAAQPRAASERLRELVCRPRAIPGTPRVWEIFPATRPANSGRAPSGPGDLQALAEREFLRLPSRPERYTSREQLLADMQSFIDRYAALPPEALPISATYAMMTWATDNFETVPYLRFLGAAESGKSRALSTVGALCYRPVIFGAATTNAAIFRTVELTRGTLLIDEAIFQGTSRDDMLAILRAGYQRGRAIPRCTGDRYGLQFFDSFGPKILAGTESFEDDALESRCITFVTHPSRARPLHLPAEFQAQARHLQNQLLRFRFEFAATILPDETAAQQASGRAAQLAATLLPFNRSPEFRLALLNHLTESAAQNVMDSDPAIVARAIIARGADNIELNGLATGLRSEAQGVQYTGAPLSNRRVAAMVRSLGMTIDRPGGKRVVRVTDAQVADLQHKFGTESAGLPVVPVAELAEAVR